MKKRTFRGLVPVLVVILTAVIFSGVAIAAGMPSYLIGHHDVTIVVEEPIEITYPPGIDTVNLSAGEEFEWTYTIRNHGEGSIPMVYLTGLLPEMLLGGFTMWLDPDGKGPEEYRIYSEGEKVLILPHGTHLLRIWICVPGNAVPGEFVINTKFFRAIPDPQ